MWIKEKRYKGTSYNSGEPLCGYHRDLVQGANPQTWENTEWRTFVDTEDEEE